MQVPASGVESSGQEAACPDCGKQGRGFDLRISDSNAEVAPDGFDIAAYRAEIPAQKNARKDHTFPKLMSSRMNYEAFKTDEKLKDKTTDSIVEDLASDDFERFYKYFDMKQEFKKQSLAAMLPSQERLVSTRWFRGQIEVLLDD